MMLNIPKTKWERGAGLGQGYFLDSHGKCCALGYLFLAYGVPAEDLMERGSISEIPFSALHQHVPPAFYDVDDFGNIVPTRLTLNITDVNDRADITDTERQTDISLYLDRLGIRVSFLEDADESTLHSQTS